MMRFNQFKERSNAYRGNFTLLWHNNHFTNKEDEILYKELIK